MSLLDEQVCETNTKWRVQLEDGSAVEAVLYRQDSLCISSQVGCAVGCPFCLTMMTDGVKSCGSGAKVEDVAENLAKRLGL